MNPILKDLLALIGTVTLGGILFLSVYAICEVTRDAISKARWKYQYKHRFDKPPTAECYCKDCKRHSDESQRCYKFEGYHTADNWFCWDAEPRER